MVATAVSRWTLQADLRKAIWEGGAGGGGCDRGSTTLPGPKWYDYQNYLIVGGGGGRLVHFGNFVVCLFLWQKGFPL